MKKSKFFGKVELINNPRTGENILKGWDRRLPIIGIESQKVKFSFLLNIDILKLLWIHLHIPNESKEIEAIHKLQIKRSVFWGTLKLKISKKSGIRSLQGWFDNIPVIGWEDRKIRNKFHLEIDEEKRQSVRNKNPQDALRAEIDTKELTTV